MSQKKRKRTVRLEPDEVAIVGRLEQWEHLILVYNTMEEMAAPEDKYYWRFAAGWIHDALEEDAQSRHEYGDEA